MTRKKSKALGKGLDSLLSKTSAARAAAAPTTAEDTLAPADDSDGSLRNLPVDLIDRGRYQPRRQFDATELEELADSIRTQGVVQPILVRPQAGRYELIAGERRWRAAQTAGLHAIPAIIRDIPDNRVAAVALIENIQRQDLNAIEEAAALQRLLDDFQMTHQEVAESVGRSRTAVTNLIRLLGLNEDVRGLVEKGGLGMGHARALLGVNGPTQSRIAAEVVAKGLSVRQVEAMVRRAQAPATTPKSRARDKDPNISTLENELGERLGAEVLIRHGSKGGKLEIRYASLPQLEGILEKIR